MKKLVSLVLSVYVFTSCAQTQQMEWISTTENTPWHTNAALSTSKSFAQSDIIIDTAKSYQSIDGFGTCFNELGWTSLSKLDAQKREDIMKEMFSPGVGANFTICRMPIAANDFAVDWYSYDETEGDLELKDFSIDHDRNTLIPFIKNAQQYIPSLRVWASPWSPPSWMKHNKHYAAVSTSAMLKELQNREKGNASMSTYMFKTVDNGLPENRQGKEGTDMFIVEEPYLKAYAQYFSKFIDAYKNEGIDIFAVAPQNEFNSTQIFPSCTWTAASLAKFIGQYLGPEMSKKGVEIMMGTMERPNELLCDTVLTDEACKKYITSVGFQWAGKQAIPGIAKKYPNLIMYQTEQECGDGKNDWKGAEYSWNLMKHYLNNGASVYTYWNTSLMQGGISRWGWAQNSLVVVDENGKDYKYTHEYYVMKHLSHYVKPGAKRIDSAGGTYKDVMAFLNLDNSIIIVAANQNAEDKTVTIEVGKNVYSPTLKAHSLNTFTIPAL